MSNVRAALAVITGFVLLGFLPKAVDLVAGVASNLLGVVIALGLLLVLVYGAFCLLAADER